MKKISLLLAFLVSTAALAANSPIIFSGACSSGAYNLATASCLSAGSSYTDANAIAAPLTGYASGSGTVSASDSVLGAIQKINGNSSGKVTAVVMPAEWGSVGTTSIQFSRPPINGTAKTTNYQMLNTDYLVTTNCASTCTITMPSPSANAGHQYAILQGNASAGSLAQVTIAANGSEKFGGSEQYSSLHINTQGEKWFLAANAAGTGWEILNHSTKMPIQMYQMATTGVTTSPTYATANTLLSYYDRDGQFLIWHYLYRHDSATGAALGSGGYLWVLPNSWTINSTYGLSSTTTTAASFAYQVNGWGGIYNGSDTSYRPLEVQFYNSTTLTLFTTTSPSFYVNSAIFPWNNGVQHVDFTAKVPITGWEP